MSPSRCALAQEQGSNQESRNDEKDAHAQFASIAQAAQPERETVGAQKMGEDNEGDRNCAQAVQAGNRTLRTTTKLAKNTTWPVEHKPPKICKGFATPG
jgi:hypothetical protein